VKLKPPPKSPAQSAQDTRSAAIPGEAGQQLIADKDVAEGSENLLNARESVFYSYFRRIYEAFYPVWHSLAQDAFREVQVPAGDYTTSMYIVFNSDGQMIHLEMLGSSGVRLFDEVAIAAWKKTPSFPNPPADLLDSSGQFHYRIKLNYEQREGGFQMLPPQRIR
jgi:hypothetical protein